MNHRWNNPILSWWPSSVGTTLGLPAAPAQPVDEAWPAPWPTTIAQTSWMPPTPTSPHLPQGGLFSSFDAGTTGGLFPRLEAPVEHLDSARYWRFASAPPPTGVSLTSAGDSYVSATPRATDWTAVPPRIGPELVRPLPEPPSPPHSNASGSDSEGGQGPSRGAEVPSAPEILSDATPYNSWIPGADYADEHHIFPQAQYKRMTRETRKVFKRSTIGELFLKLDGKRHEFDAFHREYNKATGELLKRFKDEHNIVEPEQMTPDHARALLKAIAESEDLRIKYYLEFIRRLRMFYRLRSGARGSE